MIGAALVVALANARSARRPPHAPAAIEHDALADPAAASELLGLPVDAQALAAVRAVQRAVVAIVDALIDGAPAPLEAINALASKTPLIQALEPRPDGTLRATLQPTRATVAATLIVEVIRELSELEPARLRRCARPECTLVFYDVTRSATQRWHAERPCGLRERQRRHRTRLRS